MLENATETSKLRRVQPIGSYLCSPHNAKWLSPWDLPRKPIVSGQIIGFRANAHLPTPSRKAQSIVAVLRHIRPTNKQQTTDPSTSSAGRQTIDTMADFRPRTAYPRRKTTPQPPKNASPQPTQTTDERRTTNDKPTTTNERRR